MPETNRRVIVVGGGVAGLAAAHALHERGVGDFLLLEATRRWGGVIRTEQDGGFLLEAGPDAILAQKPEGLALCRAIGLGPRLIPTNPEHRSVFILRRGCLHPLPEGMVLTIPTRVVPFLTTRLFSWRGKLRMAFELFAPRRLGGDESIAAFMRRRFGAEALELLGEPLLAGIHSGDPERLSIRATFPRLSDLEARYGSLTRGIFAARVRRRSRGSSQALFYTLRGGLGELVEALVKRIPEKRRRLGTRVRAVERAGEGYVVATNAGERLSAAAVILAAPGGAGAEILSDLAPEPAATLKAIPFVSTAVVFLGYRRADVDHPLDGYGALVPRTEALRMTACTFFSTKYAGRAPDDHVLVRGFFGGTRDPSVLDLDDRALAEVARMELGRLIEVRGEPVLERIYRWPGGTPQMEVGHLSRVAALERQLAGLPGLFLIGAGLRGTGIPDGIADASRAAATAAEYLDGRASTVCHSLGAV
ncbi:MAG: protoporphyrinogen oxidase [Vicinamibacteria bacterium]|nr:protoporphyrinogen oxidase [Vicinamibacteria bacterium]